MEQLDVAEDRELVPDSIPKALAMHTAVDRAWISAADGAELEVVVIGFWLLPEGVVDPSQAEQLFVMLSAEDARNLDEQLTIAYEVPALVDQIAEGN